MVKVPKLAAYLVLFVLVAAAVYMVYTANGIGDLLTLGGGPQTPVDPNGGTEDPPPEGETSGDDPADWELDNKNQFFVEYRLERERVRSREIDVLQQMINNPNVTNESKIEAENKLLKLQGVMELELLVENAIRAQNFDNVILIMQEDGAMVIVNADELSSEEILLIADIAAQSTGLRNSQIKISNQIGK
jgi:stage III sporulation protein AH